MIEYFYADRELARAEGDPWAELCVLASLDVTCPRLRILVLRDLGDGLGVFYNAHSAKARQLRTTPETEVLTYWDSLNVQYRLCVTLAPMPREVIESHWPRRPQVSKALDWLYEEMPQGSVIEGDQSLDGLLVQNKAKAIPPPGASGAILTVRSVDRLQLRTDGRHLRERFDGTTGVRERLVP